MACIIPRLLPGIWGWDQQTTMSPYFLASCGYLIFVNSKSHNFFSVFFPHLLSFCLYMCVCVFVCVSVCFLYSFPASYYRAHYTKPHHNLPCWHSKSHAISSINLLCFVSPICMIQYLKQWRSIQLNSLHVGCKITHVGFEDTITSIYLFLKLYIVFFIIFE